MAAKEFSMKPVDPEREFTAETFNPGNCVFPAIGSNFTCRTLCSGCCSWPKKRVPPGTRFCPECFHRWKVN